MANYPYPFFLNDTNAREYSLRGDGTWQKPEKPEPPKYSISLTYEELKNLRDNKQLKPGCKYRITDYVTTTTQPDTRSAGHPFDIVVEALSNDRLAAEARVVKKSTSSGLYLWEKFDNQYEQEYGNDAWASYLNDSKGIYFTKGWMITDTLYTPGSLSMENYALALGAIAEVDECETNTYIGSEFDDALVECVLDTISCPNAVDMGNNKELRIYKTDYAGIEGLDPEGIYDPGEFGEPDHVEYYVYVGEFEDTCGIFGGSGETVDPYFENADTDAWKIWYCLDNDSDRFYWADDSVDEGIPATMDIDANGMDLYVTRYPDGDINNTLYAWKDNNSTDLYYTDTETPIYTDQSDGTGDSPIYDSNGDRYYHYDIFNITPGQEGTGLSNGRGVIYRMIDEFNNDCPYDFKNIQFKRKLTNGVYDPTNGTDTWCYTFTWINENNNVDEASVSCQNIDADEGYIYGVHDNFMCQCIEYNAGIDDHSDKLAFALNGNVFISAYQHAAGWFYGIYGNHFGTDCAYNTFGNSCNSNTFSNECSSNTLGDSCHSNRLGNNCFSNTFGNNCYSNTFENGCYYNTFGGSCGSNTFGNECNNNTFGGRCMNNTFGNNCKYIRFANATSETPNDYYRYITVEDSVEYVLLRYTGTLNRDNQLQNIKICTGVKGTYNSHKQITHPTVNDTFQTVYRNDEEGTTEGGIVALKSDLSSYVTSGYYDSSTHKIYLRHDTDVLSEIDANDFIKDGMVSNVAVVGNNIVISFNTDSGKEDIEIPIVSIFDADAYVDKRIYDSVAEMEADTDIKNGTIACVKGELKEFTFDPSKLPPITRDDYQEIDVVKVTGGLKLIIASNGPGYWVAAKWNGGGAIKGLYTSYYGEWPTVVFNLIDNEVEPRFPINDDFGILSDCVSDLTWDDNELYYYENGWVKMTQPFVVNITCNKNNDTFSYSCERNSSNIATLVKAGYPIPYRLVPQSPASSNVTNVLYGVIKEDIYQGTPTYLITFNNVDNNSLFPSGEFTLRHRETDITEYSKHLNKKVYTCNDLSELSGDTTIKDGDLACVNKRSKYVYVDTEHIFTWYAWLSHASSTVALSDNNVFTSYDGWDIKFNGESLMSAVSGGSTKCFKPNAAIIIQSVMVDEPISTLSEDTAFNNDYKGYIEIKDNIVQEWYIRSNGSWVKYDKDYYTKTESDAQFTGKPLKVTILSTEQNGNTTYSADKTYAEILAAYQAGRDIVAIYEGAEVALNEFIQSENGGGFIFTVHYGNIVQQVFISENGVSVVPLTFVEEDNVATINSQSLTRGGNITLPTPTDITELQTALANYCPIIEDTRTSEKAAITGVAPFSELKDGQKIALRLHYNTVNNATLNLTLSDGTTTGDIYLYYRRTDNYVNKIYIAYGLFIAGQYVEMFYTAATNRWICVSDHDTNTTYAKMTQAMVDAGTATLGAIISPELLVENFEKRTQMVSVDNQSAQVEQALESNKFYKFLNPVDELTLTLVAPTGYGDVMGIYAGKFTASANWSALSLPVTVQLSSSCPTIIAGATYEFNICDNIIIFIEI